VTLDEINTLPDDLFIETFGSIYEHSPWVARQVIAKRPFDSLAHLAREMQRCVSAASHADKLSLLRAHPELAGKAAIDGTLTTASRQEQASAGLDRMLADEFKSLTEMNAAYTEKFGFPFIICVRLHTKASIMAALRQRLDHSPAQEFDAALSEVDSIARLRLEGVIS